jgi:U3 small nucleolar RNA-associated protein 7
MEPSTGATQLAKRSSGVRQNYQGDEAAELQRRAAEAQNVYGRGRKVSIRGVKDKKLRGNLRRLESKYQDATLKAKDAEILLENEAGFLEAEGELERTYKIRQDELKQDLAVETAKKGFELKLVELGPYIADYSRNGRHLLLTGRKGHLSTIDWRAGELGCELQLGETIRDAKWLHNNQYFAVSQKKYVYIYDSAGVELHCLRKHIEVTSMEFLPYHFLLATVVGLCFKWFGCLLTMAGECRILEIYRHFYWADGY